MYMYMLCTDIQIAVVPAVSVHVLTLELQKHYELLFKS